MRGKKNDAIKYIEVEKATNRDSRYTLGRMENIALSPPCSHLVSSVHSLAAIAYRNQHNFYLIYDKFMHILF